VSALPASCKWWRYPIKPPKTLGLDHTRLRGKNRAKHPVQVFTTKECRAYVPAEFRGHRNGLLDSRTCDSPHVAKQKQRREEACRLVIKGTWTFHGAYLPYTERWTFTPAKQRNRRRVRPSFKGPPIRVRNLPAWPEPLIRVKVKGVAYHFRSARFHWKPDHHQSKSVQWTRMTKIETTNLRHFLVMKPYKPISLP
jgi:hypothetical protein